MSKVFSWQRYYTPAMRRLTFPQTSLWQQVAANNRSHLQQTALVYLGATWSYGQLLAQIETLSLGLAALKIKPGEVVSVCSLLTPETIACLYALNRLGAISDWLDPRMQTDKICQQLSQAEARVIILLSPFVAKFAAAIAHTKVKTIIILSPTRTGSVFYRTLGWFKSFTCSHRQIAGVRQLSYNQVLSLGRGKNASPHPYYPRRPAIIVHTGGTTGKAKRVLLSDDAINAEVHQVANFYTPFARQERWLSYLPPFVVVGLVNCLHLPLVVGMKIFLVPNFNTMTLGKQIKAYHPEHIPCIALHWREIIESDDLTGMKLDFVKSIIVGGDIFYRALEQRLLTFLKAHHCLVRPTKCYGLSETASVVIAGYNKQATNKLGSVGIPMPGNEVAIRSLDGKNFLPHGQVGEICLAGPTLMLGYHRDPEASKKVLRRHHGKLWLYTGDLGYLDADGVLFLSGRLKRVIIRRGFKVYPLEIEQFLLQQKEIKLAVVVGKKDSADDSVPCAHLQLHQQYYDQKNHLLRRYRQLCQKKFAAYQVPVAWYVHRELPLTANGKMDYRFLENYHE